MIGLGIDRLLRKTGMKVVVADCIAALFLVGYGILIGMPSSAFRAIFLLLFRILAERVGRSTDEPTTIALSAFLWGIQYPLAFLNAGLQLSYGIVFGQYLLKDLFDDFPKRYQKGYQQIILFLITFPIISYHYWSYPVYGVLCNLLLLPLLGVVLIFGFLLLVFSMISPEAVWVIAQNIRFLIWIYRTVSEWSLSLWGSQWILGQPGCLQICVYVAGLFMLAGFANKMKKRYLIAGLLSLVCILLIRFPKTDMITILDVGQGDGIVIQTKSGECMTIDGGSSSKKDVGNKLIEPYLKGQGIRSVEYAVLTHLDEDHINGILQILEDERSAIRIRNLVISKKAASPNEECYQRLVAACEKKNTTIVTIQKGDKICCGDFLFTCISPGTMDQTKDSNDASLVLELQINGYHALFTGDLSSEMEQKIIPRLHFASYDLLKVSHHGSKNATDSLFVNRICPATACISVGEGNRYGHPHKETLDRLQNVSKHIIRTDQSGCIEIKIRKKQVEMSLFRGG